mmetsp:Transcript_22886/g.34376  ORF Transcript_22886/g.34376 Transcript_22886/m.34376 type:complete len:92 (+) Transcript_22886:141-416(+)
MVRMATDVVYFLNPGHAGKPQIFRQCFGNCRHNEWAVLECSVSTEDCIGESFPLLFAEPLVVADAARLSGWQCKVVLEDRNRHQALVRLTK